MSSDSRNTSRTVVKTYVPAYQKEKWQQHADELDMSQSEFVRTMVQAGRRGFLDTQSSLDSTEGPPQKREQADSPDRVTRSVDGMAKEVASILTTDEYHSWEELLEALTDDIEDRLEEALQELQDENAVRYSGRYGGYTLVES